MFYVDDYSTIYEEVYSLSNYELNKAFALEIVGYDDVNMGAVWVETKWGVKPRGPLLDYCASFELVYPWIGELSPDWKTRTSNGCSGTTIALSFVGGAKNHGIVDGKTSDIYIEATHKNFATAAVIACIVAARALRKRAATK